MLSLVSDYRGNPYPVSRQDLIDFCNVDGSRSIRWSTQHRAVRYRVLDASFTPVNTGYTGPYGATDLGDITSLVTGCQISLDGTRDVPGTCQLSMRVDPSYGFDPLQHQIQPLIQIWDGEALEAGSTLIDEVPLGVYFCAVPDLDIIPTGNMWTCSMTDVLARVKQAQMINTWEVPTGTLFTDQVRTWLTMDFLPQSQGGQGKTPVGLDDAGPAIPTSHVNLTGSTLALPGPVSRARGDDKLAACNDLLASINYYPLWVDQMGVIQSAPRPNLSTDAPTTVWTYATNDPSRAITGPIQQRYGDLSQLANCMVVYRESASCDVPNLCSIDYNVNTAASKIALGNLKRPIVKVIRDDSVPDQASCDARADLELQIAASLQETVTVPIFPNPFLAPHDYVQLVVTDPTGQTTYINAPFEVLGYQLDPAAWTMSVTLGKAIPV